MYHQRIRAVLSIGLLLLLSVSLLGCSQKQINNNQLDSGLVINDYAPAEINEAEFEATEDVPLGATNLSIEDESDSEPPFSVYCADIDELILFTRAVELSDEDFEAFIYEEPTGKYYMNGISNKEDLRTVLAWLEDMPIPISNQFELKGITIFQESKEVHFLFENENGNRCSFDMYMDDTAAIDYRLQERKDNNKSFEEVPVPSNHTIKHVYYLGKYISPYLHANPAYYFLADYETCCVKYQTTGIQDYDAAVDALYEFTYSDILSLGVG